jgi:type I restriction enzyme S subunit
MVPEGWRIKQVGDLFDVQLGKMLNKAAKEKTPQYQYLGNSNVKWGFFDLSDLNTMHFSDREVEKFTLKLDDIIMCEGGEVGRCAIWKGSTQAIFYQKALHRLRSKGQVAPHFFQHYMEKIAGTKLLDDYTTRTSIAHLTREKLISLPVLLPPLPEQKKIAQILSTWDKAITTTEQLLANSQQQKKALMQQLLTGKNRLLDDNGVRFRGDFKRFHFSELLEIDKKSLSSRTDPNFEFDYISLSDVDAGGIASNLEKHVFKLAPSRAKRIVSVGDILFATVRPNLQGFARVQEQHKSCIASTGFAVLSPKTGTCIDYVFHYLFAAHISGQINALVVGTNYPAINSSDVGGLCIYCPSYEEQLRIANVLNSNDKFIFALQQKLKALKQEKKALMQQLLTGKRRVKVDEEAA